MGCTLQFGDTEFATPNSIVTLSSGSQTAIDVDNEAIELSTPISESSSEAYSEYIEAKRKAMETGGSSTLYGYSFTQGYAGVISNILTNVNGIRPDSNGNVSFGSTIGVYFRTGYTVYPSPDYTSTTYTLTVCDVPTYITCTDYNKLFAAEMVLYHAINKLAWRIERPLVLPYINGTWELYQGALARWNNYTYQSAYISLMTSLRENLSAQIGWVNNTCTPTLLHVYATVTCTTNNSGAYIDDLLFYPQNLLCKTGSRDNNTYTAGSPMYYIAKNTSVFTNATLAELVSGGATFLSGYTVVTDLQALSDVTGGGPYILGLIVPSVKGNDYYIQQFSYNYRALLTDAVQGVYSSKDTYSISVTWNTTPEGGSMSTVTKDLGTYQTYSVEVSE